jgi:hypothetical protein
MTTPLREVECQNAGHRYVPLYVGQPCRIDGSPSRPLLQLYRDAGSGPQPNDPIGHARASSKTEGR